MEALGDPHVEIVDFTPEYAEAFRVLNLAWIERYFSVEAEDVKLLSDPMGEIVNSGGYIAVALLDTLLSVSSPCGVGRP